MNSERFSYFLRNPSQLYEISFQELQHLILQYPYCQNLRYLLVKKSQLDEQKDYQKLLEKAATYAVDRRYLYRLINNSGENFDTTDDYLLAPEMLELNDLSNEALSETEQLEPAQPTVIESFDFAKSEVESAPEKDDSLTLNELIEKDTEETTQNTDTSLIDQILEDDSTMESYQDTSPPSSLLDQNEITDTSPSTDLPSSSDPSEKKDNEMDSKKNNDKKSKKSPENEDLLSLLAKYSRENKIIKRIRRKSKSDKDKKNLVENIEGLEKQDLDDLSEMTNEEKDFIEIENESEDTDEIPFEIENQSNEAQIIQMDNSNDEVVIDEEEIISNTEEPIKPVSQLRPVSSLDEVLDNMLEQNMKIVPPREESKKKRKKKKKKKISAKKKVSKKKKAKILELSKLPPHKDKTDLERLAETNRPPKAEEEAISEIENELIKEFKESIEGFKKKKTKTKKKEQKKIKSDKKAKKAALKKKAKKSEKKKKKKKRKKKEDAVVQLAKKSIKKSEDTISETLARLLAEQGHTDMAIMMYERLSLIFPKKSTLFAAEIQKLKKIKK